MAANTNPLASMLATASSIDDAIEKTEVSLSLLKFTKQNGMYKAVGCDSPAEAYVKHADKLTAAMNAQLEVLEPIIQSAISKLNLMAYQVDGADVCDEVSLEETHYKQLMTGAYETLRCVKVAKSSVNEVMWALMELKTKNFEFELQHHNSMSCHSKFANQDPPEEPVIPDATAPPGAETVTGEPTANDEEPWNGAAHSDDEYTIRDGDESHCVWSPESSTRTPSEMQEEMQQLGRRRGREPDDHYSWFGEVQPNDRNPEASSSHVEDRNTVCSFCTKRIPKTQTMKTWISDSVPDKRKSSPGEEGADAGGYWNAGSYDNDGDWPSNDAGRVHRC